MSRNEAGLKATIERVRQLRDEFWHDVKVPGTGESFNQNLEHAGRVADFLEFAELLVADALDRKESCGGHFREEYQSPEDEAQRDDENFCYVAPGSIRESTSRRCCTKSRSILKRPARQAELQVRNGRPTSLEKCGRHRSPRSDRKSCPATFR